MRIRAALPVDSPALRELWDLGREAFHGAPLLMRDGTFEGLLERITDHGVLVAEDHDGELCGMVTFRMDGETYVGTSVSVRPAYRLNGLGRMLILAAHEIARVKGAKRAIAVMWDGHPHLAGFYRSVGYEPAARLLTKELA